MRTHRLLLSVSLSAALMAGASMVAARQATMAGVPPQVAAVLADIKKRDANLYAVSEEDGRFLRVLVGARGAKRVLEIGGANGYSAIWMGLGLRDTGGHLVTIEYDAARAKDAKANVERAGVSANVRVISGDAFAEIPKLEGTFDLIFLDAWKPDYIKFFNMTFPRLEPGGLFVAHNVVNKRDEMKDFLTAITTRPDAWTSIIAPSGEGISLTYKKRLQ
jgi:predicted O-methyltransferase YrrM